MPQTCFTIPQTGVCRVCRRRYEGIFVIYLDLDLDNFLVWLKVNFLHRGFTECCSITMHLDDVRDLIEEAR